MYMKIYLKNYSLQLEHDTELLVHLSNNISATGFPWYTYSIWDALRDLVPFRQFEKREKHILKGNTRPWVFFTFFKSYKWYQMVPWIVWHTWIGRRITFFFLIDHNILTCILYCRTKIPFPFFLDRFIVKLGQWKSGTGE